MFSDPQHYTDHPILQSLLYDKELVTPKKDRNADEIFFEYLSYTKFLTNREYYLLILKFILLFRECFNLNKKETDSTTNEAGQFIEYSKVGNTETLPELCNTFVADFLENNDYFGIESKNSRYEIIELIQHFCYWLFKNDYTKSRLSLTNGE